MDERFKKSCPNCCQLYTLQSLSPQTKSNIPLFIKCGHSMCESCIRNIVKFGESIECKICRREMEIKTTDTAKLLQNKIELYKLFPVNVNMLGELALKLIAEKSEVLEKNEDSFIDLKAIIASTEKTLGQCLECLKETATMCHQCATIICEECFDKSHKNFVVFKSHFLQNIEAQIMPNNCEVHSEKSLDYYCKDCAKSVCTDCLMVGAERSCKSHDLVPTVEMNKVFVDDLREISPQVGAIFRRLTKTAVDIGHLLHNIENDTESSELKQVTATIEQHFSKLYAEIQSHKDQVMSIIARLKDIEKDSLVKAKNNVAKAIKDSKHVMSLLKSALGCENNKSANLATLMEDVQKILNKPWYLSKDESAKDTLKVIVNEDLCMLISDYIHLEGNAKALYKLRATHELDGVDIPPPPHAPVYPPELPRDVRFDKSGLTNGKPVTREIPVQLKKSIRDGPSNVQDDIQRISSELKKTTVQPVQPFAENKSFLLGKAIGEGVQELIRITHIVDPDNLFVQLISDEGVLNEMMEELQHNLREITKEISVGGTCVVNNNNTWMRCVVESIDMSNANNPTYHVTCVDVGSMVSVTIADLRDAPVAFAVGAPRGRYPTPLAVRCRLANCKPKTGIWTKDDTDLVRKIVGNDRVIIHVRQAGAVSQCDINTLDGVSIAHALAFHGRAVLPKPYLPYPEVRGIPEKPKIYMSNNNFNSKTCEHVFITNVVRPDKFYVREVYLQEDFNRLCKELNKEYHISDTSESIYMPEPGLFCVVLINKEDDIDYIGWTRAVVKSLKEGLVKVYLIDLGATVEVSWDRLRKINRKFTVVRGLVCECHLAGILPSGREWRRQATALLETYKGRVLKLYVDKKYNRKTVGAILYCESDNLCINQELVVNNFAEPSGTATFKLLDRNTASTERAFDCDSSTQISQIKSDLQTFSENTDSELPASEPPMMPKSGLTELQENPKGVLKLEVKIVRYDSPSLIYVSLVYQQKVFNELFEKIQKFYMKRQTPRRENWKVNDRCCALCIQSETWRRAAIIEVQRNTVTVFYTDFACTETVPISNLKKLHPDFENHPDAAIKCHLSGVLPALGEEWPTLSKEFLKERLDSYTRAFITKVGDFKDKSMPIELWVYHTVQGSALEPDKSEWLCLNKEIIDQGLGLPDKSLQTATNSTAPQNSEDDMLSFLNMTGSVRDYLLLPRSVNTPVMSSGSDASSPTKGGYDFGNEEFISEWLPAEPLTTTEFTGVPTYIDNDGIIYLHDVTQREVLELIRDTLEIAFKDADPKAQYYTWRVGEPCVARYYLDNNFYRGTVLEVNKEQGNCLILYVDYGNHELCSFAQLRKGIALHQIPVQAHKCVLSRVTPTGGKWELNVLDYIHKAIVEKQCFVKVVGEPIDSLTPIDLKYDKLWINDHLVEFDMAIYTDGSKPKVRKFTPVKRTIIKPQQVIKLDTQSEPDYVVEEDVSSEPSASPDSFKMSTLVNDRTDSNESEEVILGSFLSYPKHEMTEFDCNVTVINDTNSLVLSVVREEESNAQYENIFEKIEKEGENMPALDGVFENKACIALFPEDNKWYRASILQYSESKNLIKIRYVDYGNIGVVSLTDVREISKEWADFPPLSISATLHGIKVNPNLDINDVKREYIDMFLDKGPFRAKIIGYKNSLPCVECKDTDDEVVYKKMIEKGVFLKNKCENCS